MNTIESISVFNLDLAKADLQLHLEYYLESWKHSEGIQITCKKLEKILSLKVPRTLKLKYLKFVTENLELFQDGNLLGIILKFIVNEFDKSDKSSSLSLTAHKILLTLSESDRKFALKAKIAGSVDLSFALFRNTLMGFSLRRLNVSLLRIIKVYNDIFRVYLGHKMNATILGKAGIIDCFNRILLKLFGKHKTTEYLQLLPFKRIGRSTVAVDFPSDRKISKSQFKCLNIILSTLLLLLTKSNCDRVLKCGCFELLLGEMVIFALLGNSAPDDRSILILLIRCLIELVTRSMKAKRLLAHHGGLHVAYLLCTGQLDSFLIVQKNQQLSPIKKRAFSVPERLSFLPAVQFHCQQDTILTRYFAFLIASSLPKSKVPVMSLSSPYRIPVAAKSPSSVVNQQFEDQSNSDSGDSSETSTSSEKGKVEQLRKLDREEIFNLRANYSFFFPELYSADLILSEFECREVRTLLDQVTVPFPDVNLAVGSAEKEPFSVVGEEEKMEGHASLPLLQHVEEIVKAYFRFLEPNQQINKTVFDLDQLVGDGAGQATTGATDGLIFESRFECGNLRKAIQVKEFEYDLVLTPDVNLTGRIQWFYFSVANMKSGIPYTFNIINLDKPASQYSHGMQVLLCSSKRTGHEGGSAVWKRVGTNIKYYRSILYKNSKRSLYTATFTLVFEYEKDVCYLAYHYPYSYTRLLLDIQEWRDRVLASSDIFFKVQTLTTTLLGNEVPLLTISSANEKLQKQKEYVVLTARVHPGESNSSWVLRGLINRLLDPTDCEMTRLRQKFIFKIVPMLNPDGVVVGNHRTSLSGHDLNRQWLAPDQKLHPEIFHTKNLFEFLKNIIGQSPFLYIDFHGHSCLKDIFLYGCLPSKSWLAPCDLDNPSVILAPSDTEEEELQNDPLWTEANGKSALVADFSDVFKTPSCSTVNENLVCIQLAHLMHNLAPSFSESRCSWAVQKAKESTARIVVWRQFGVLRSYTMEASYCGTSRNCFQDQAIGGHQISTSHLEATGSKLCEAILLLDRAWEPGKPPGMETVADPVGDRKANLVLFDFDDDHDGSDSADLDLQSHFSASSND